MRNLTGSGHPDQGEGSANPVFLVQAIRNTSAAIISELIGLVSAGANTGVCIVARDDAIGAMASIEVLAGSERRRR
jgi:hypothetical protein